MKLAFLIYRGLVALGLLGLAGLLTVLGLTRPIEISESTPLLLAIAGVALVLMVVALIRRPAASVALLVTGLGLSAVYLSVEPSLATAPIAVTCIEFCALIWFRPWR